MTFRLVTLSISRMTCSIGIMYDSRLFGSAAKPSPTNLADKEELSSNTKLPESPSTKNVKEEDPGDPLESKGCRRVSEGSRE